MCGFFGFWDPKRRVFDSDERANHIIQHGCELIRHRGPDDHGVFVESGSAIALGHSRLSIIDVSPMGHQPMQSHTGRYVIVYNGEIYNFEHIRKEIESSGSAPGWKGHSDTEVLLAAIETWGFAQTLTKLNGMFSFALWDSHEKSLILARDRMGEKPLYYSNDQGVLVFGSELKALRSFPGYNHSIDIAALKAMIGLGYVPSPLSIHQGTFKIKPGHYLRITVQLDGDLKNISPENQTCYWDIQQVAQQGILAPLELSEEEQIVHLEQETKRAVGLRMVSDVPLGAFLSGGYDSSLVVAMMQAQSTQRVKTFSIGFNEELYNEAEHAKSIAAHLGTDHTELYVTHRETLDMVPEIPKYYDEPFADSSQIPTYLVSKMARQYVTVTLSGDGGDELFGGYNRYVWGESVWNKIRVLPPLIKKLLTLSLSTPSSKTWNNLFKWFGSILPKKAQVSLPGDKIAKLSKIIDAPNPQELYRRLVHQWAYPETILSSTSPHDCNQIGHFQESHHFIDAMMLSDLQTYLPDDILVKVDRASMAVSLESRVPFLDHHLIEFAWRIPRENKIRNGVGKWILKQVLHKYVPKKLMERPKMGFGVPIDAWLRGPLRSWAEDLLNRDVMMRQGYLNTDWVHKRWKEHLSGKRNFQDGLWNILMFQAWLNEMNKS